MIPEDTEWAEWLVDGDYVLPPAPIRILIIIDGRVYVDPRQSFSLDIVIEHLRRTRVGCTTFTVDIAARAEWAQPSSGEPPRYRDFVIDERIDDYDQLWLFGDTTLDPDSGSDASFLPGLAMSEVAKISEFMSGGGGVFATGDHYDLGSSLSALVPRVRQMRRWTMADEAPAISPSDVGWGEPIDTVQPEGSERDTELQPITFVPWRYGLAHRFVAQEFAHPILCHPTLGVIDVMPDHAHEGRVRSQDEMDVDRSMPDGMPEFPQGPDGGRPLPTVIATGVTTDGTNIEFPMINVYDGLSIGHGRVVCDSTWHHWFRMNVCELHHFGSPSSPGFDAGSDAAHDWAKVARYYVNIGLWLTPEKVVEDCVGAVAAVPFSYPGIEKARYAPKTPGLGELIEFGSLIKDSLVATEGQCWVTRFLWDYMPVVIPPLARLVPRRSGPLPSLLTLEASTIEDLALGTFGAVVYSELEQFGHGRNAKRATKPCPIDLETVTKRARAELHAQLGQLCDAMASQLKELAELLGCDEHA